MSKSYVTMEQHVCPVCTQAHDTGNLLLDTRLQERFDMHTPTGWELCPDCARLRDDGYVALIVCDPRKSVMHRGDTKDGAAIAKLEDAYRTGDYVHIRLAAFQSIFNTSPPSGLVAFIDEEIFEFLKEISPPPDADCEGHA